MGKDINNTQFMEELLPLPVGVSGFKKAVENYYYVDKTLFIKELRTKKAEVTLITRPRRFGKTLNMDMLRCFFEKTEESNQSLFENLNIWNCGDKYTSEQGIYPVIFFTLKDVKFTNWKNTFLNLKELIAKEYDRHSYLLQSNHLSDREKVYISKVIHGELEVVGLTDSLKNLSEFLYKHHNVRPIILLDEYDMPIQSGYSNGFYAEVIEFMRNWMSGGLKDNENLSFAVITGILKVAQESIFSGLNNPSICTIFDKNYNTYFGFTEDEVFEMAKYYGKSEKMSEIKQWYDGYNFTNIDIYNPWSVINYFAEDCEPMSYWLSTSSNDVIKKMLCETNHVVKTKLYNLMKGYSESVTIDLSIVYPNLETNPESIFSLLLLTGYLKTKKMYAYNKVTATCDVTIPNYEIKTVYQTEILSYIKEQFKITTTDDIIRAIICHNTAKLSESLNNFMLKSMSYMDAKSEDFYQGFMLCLGGLFTDKYDLKENREAGNGRYDFALIPLNIEDNLPGIVMEFKALTDDFKPDDDMKHTLGKVACKALEQIEEKQYDTDMWDRGCKTVLHYGAAFHKKNVHIESRTVVK